MKITASCIKYLYFFIGLAAGLSAASAHDLADNAVVFEARKLQSALCRCEASWEDYYLADPIFPSGPHYNYSTDVFDDDLQLWAVEDVLILTPTNDACGTRRRLSRNETSPLLEIPPSANKDISGEMEVAEDGMETPIQPRDLQRYYSRGRNPYGFGKGARFSKGGVFTKGGGRARPGIRQSKGGPQPNRRPTRAPVDRPTRAPVDRPTRAPDSARSPTRAPTTPAPATANIACEDVEDGFLACCFANCPLGSFPGGIDQPVGTECNACPDECFNECPSVPEIFTCTVPTNAPTLAPVANIVVAPTRSPTQDPTAGPTKGLFAGRPTPVPTRRPTHSPTRPPTPVITANCETELSVSVQSCQDVETGPFGRRDCDDLRTVDLNGETSCRREVSMELCATNVGSRLLSLTSFTLEIEGRTKKDILSSVRSLTSGQTECVTITAVVNACESPVEAVVVAGARGVSTRVRNICSASTSFTLGAKQSTINQVCKINLKARCSAASDSRVDCSQIARPTDRACSCTGQCAASYDFLYTGQSCASQTGNGFISCEDFEETNKPSFVSIIVRDRLSSPPVVLFDDLVREDEVFTVESSGCFPEEIVVDVFSRGGGSGSARHLQTMTINTSCNSNGIRLGGDSNALELSGYQCQRDSGEASCLVGVNIRACVTNGSSGDFDLSAFEIKVENEPRADLLGDAPVRIEGPAGRYCRNQIFRINVCNDDDPLVILEAEGDQGQCTAYERFALSAATRPPTMSPMREPTPRPVASILARPTPRSPTPPRPTVNVFDDNNNRPRPNVVARRYYGRGRDWPGTRQGKGGLGIRQGKGFRALMTEEDQEEGEVLEEEVEESEGDLSSR